MASFLDEKTMRALSDLYGHSILNMEHNRLMALSLAYQEGCISNERLRYSLDMHRYDITQMLRSMCNDGLLVSVGTGRGTYYRLPDVASNVASNEFYRQVGSVKKRMRQEELFAKIQETAEDWVSLEEIAYKVGRRKQYLNNRIIPTMVAAGLLERKIPLNPKSPDQMYRRKR